MLLPSCLSGMTWCPITYCLKANSTLCRHLGDQHPRVAEQGHPAPALQPKIEVRVGCHHLKSRLGRGSFGITCGTDDRRQALWRHRGRPQLLARCSPEVASAPGHVGLPAGQLTAGQLASSEPARGGEGLETRAGQQEASVLSYVVVFSDMPSLFLFSVPQKMFSRSTAHWRGGDSTEV